MADTPETPTEQETQIQHTYNYLDLHGLQVLWKRIRAEFESLDSTIAGEPGNDKTLTEFIEVDGKVTAKFDKIDITLSQVSDLKKAISITTTTDEGGTTEHHTINFNEVPVVGTVTNSGADDTGDNRAASTAYVIAKIDQMLSATDAMKFKGTVGDGGTISVDELNSLTDYEAGWSYKVVGSDPVTIHGMLCRNGDMVICVKDYDAEKASDADWTSIEANNDGHVISSSAGKTTVVGDIAVFDDTTGHVIKDSGYQIGYASKEQHYVPVAEGDDASTKSDKVYHAQDGTISNVSTGQATAQAIPVMTGVKVDKNGHVVAIETVDATVPMAVASTIDSSGHPDTNTGNSGLISGYDLAYLRVMESTTDTPFVKKADYITDAEILDICK